MSPRRTILLVEDEELVRNYLKQLLTNNAWTVTAAASGHRALAQLAASEFDIVLCDLDLGRGPNGLDVLSRMPSNNEETPFVILTAHGSTGRCREAFLRGATDFLEKPVRRAALLATLDHAITDAADAAESPIDVAATDDVLALPYDEAGAAHVRGAIQSMERRYPEFDLTVGDVAAEEGVSPDYLARLSVRLHRRNCSRQRDRTAGPTDYPSLNVRCCRFADGPVQTQLRWSRQRLRRQYSPARLAVTAMRRRMTATTIATAPLDSIAAPRAAAARVTGSSLTAGRATVSATTVRTVHRSDNLAAAAPSVTHR